MERIELERLRTMAREKDRALREMEMECERERKEKEVERGRRELFEKARAASEQIPALEVRMASPFPLEYLPPSPLPPPEMLALHCTDAILLFCGNPGDSSAEGM